MFGIFQADLPIGRTIWLVALTLIVTTLISGAPLNLPSDPVTFAVAMLVYTGHSFVLGFLYALVPTFIIITIDWWALLRKSESWDQTAILFEHPRYDLLRDIVDNVALVGAAALAAGRFGQPSLNASGVFGLSCIILAEVLDLKQLFTKFSKDGLPVLELRSAGNARSVARIFSSGKLLSEISLNEDFASALVHLREARWKLALDVGACSERSAWLRKRTAEHRLRLIAKVAESHPDVASEFKEGCLSLVAVAELIGWVSGLVGAGLTIYLANRLPGAHDPITAVIASGRLGIIAVGMAVAGAIVIPVSVALTRLLSSIRVR